MAERRINVQEGQSLYDIAMQELGTLEELFTIFALNPAVNINTDLVALQELIIDSDGIGDEEIKGAYTRLDYVTNNAQLPPGVFVPDEGNYIWQDGDDVLVMDGNDMQLN